MYYVVAHVQIIGITDKASDLTPLLNIVLLVTSLMVEHSHLKQPLLALETERSRTFIYFIKVFLCVIPKKQTTKLASFPMFSRIKRGVDVSIIAPF